MDVIDEIVDTKFEKKVIKKFIIKIGRNYKLSLNDVRKLCTQDSLVQCDKDTLKFVNESHAFFQSFVDRRTPIYGTNTQFGDQVCHLDHHMKNEDVVAYYDSINKRQENLLKSHVCSMGDPLPLETVKVAMMLRVHCLAQGYSGISPKVIEAFLSFLNAGITPVVPKYGSIGASGDLIPLATLAAAIIGENVSVHYKGNYMFAPQALKLANLVKLEPQLRDGLAMINGTSFMTAVASVSLYNLQRLFDQMLICIAMTLEALMIISSAYHPLVHYLKQQSGQIKINQFFIDFWQGSQLLSDLDELREQFKNQNEKPTKAVQDYYSLRSVAQGFGPFKENLKTAIRWIENEMNSVNDNPIVDSIGKQILHNANFMGYYVTDACDILKINIAQASTWLHALLANLVHPRKNNHLPTNLVEDSAIYNGFRPLQLLAASLAVQNRKFAQAQQAYTLPTEGDNQDVNSLGMHAALDFRESVLNLERLVAVILLAAVQALEFRGIQRASPKAQKIYQIVRSYSPTLKECRPMSDELNLIVDVLQQEKI